MSVDVPAASKDLGETEIARDEETLLGSGAQPSEPPRDALGAGESVGRYVVLERLGAGGMGIVYAAYDPELDRKVALKLLRPEGGDQERATVAHSRLLREAQAMARLSHPNVISVHDAGTYEGQVFVAMEFVAGGTLADWMRSSHPWPTTVDMFMLAGRGLAAAHEAGLVHRDFKPENVLVGRDASVMVADFGLARAPQVDADVLSETDRKLLSASAGEPSSANVDLTRTGAIMGTPAYMAPEQSAGGEVDARADQFAFCVAFYEALYGERPFAGKTLAQPVAAAVSGRIREAPKGRHVPGWLRRTLVKGLEVNPDHRYPDMPELLRALDWRGRRRRHLWLAGSVPVAAAVVATVAFNPLGPESPTPECDESPAQLEVVLGDARRSTITRALGGVSVNYATDVSSRVEQELDAFAQGWERAHRDACEATWIRGEQSQHVLDLRMACLERALATADATAGVLENPDAKTLERALALVSQLPQLEDCADAARLDRRVAPPAASIAQDVAELDRQLEQSAALRSVGRLEEARPLAQSILDRARTLDYPPILARALRELAAVHNHAQAPEAEAVAHEAFVAAIDARSEIEMAQAANRLLIILGEDERRGDELDRWHRIAIAAWGASDAGEDLRAAILTNVGNALRRRGDFDAATRTSEEVLGIYERNHPPGHHRIGDAHYNLGVLHHTRGDIVRAYELFLQVEDEWRDWYPPGHPRWLAVQQAMAITMFNMGRYEEAERKARTVLDAWIELRGETLHTASYMYSYASVLDPLNRPDESKRWLDRAEAIIDETPGDHRRDRLLIVGNRIQLAFRLGQLDHARAHLVAFSELAAELFDGPHRRSVSATEGWASLSLLEQNWEQAFMAADRGLAEMEALGLSSHPLGVALPLYRAVAASELGRADEARRDFERAKALADSVVIRPRQKAWLAFVGAVLDWPDAEAIETLERLLADFPSDEPEVVRQFMEDWVRKRRAQP